MCESTPRRAVKDKTIAGNCREIGKLSSKYIKFPLTKCILWASVSKGPTVVVNLTYYQKPIVTVDLTAVNTGFKSVLKPGKHVLVSYLHGNVSSCADGEKLAIALEKLEIPPECATPLCQPICDAKYSSLCHMRIGACCHTSQDVSDESINLMKRSIQGTKLGLGNILPSRVECVFDEKAEQRIGCNLTFTCVTIATTFQAAPIQCLPIICTALAKSLADPFSQSSIHKEPKSGFLTMNEKRCLLLLLENDPKIYSLPLVGIWVSGVNSVRDIYTWRAALRYLYCDELKEKVYNAAGCFLVVVYSKIDPNPTIYEFSIIEDLSIPQIRSYAAQQYFSFGAGNTTGKVTLELHEVDAANNLPEMESSQNGMREYNLKGKLHYSPAANDDVAESNENQNLPESEVAEVSERRPKTFVPRHSVPNDVYQALANQEQELRLLRSQLNELLKEREDNTYSNPKTAEGTGSRVSASTMTSNVWSPTTENKGQTLKCCSCSGNKDKCVPSKGNLAAKRTANVATSSLESSVSSCMTLGDVKMQAVNDTSPETTVSINLQDYTQSEFSFTSPTASCSGDEILENGLLYNNLLERINSVLGRADSNGEISPRENLQLDSGDGTFYGGNATNRLPCESILLPKLQYASFCDADKTVIDESADFDNLAMKYLRKKCEVAPSANDAYNPSSVTVYGMGANNLSLATKQYLKKYKLL